MNVWGSYLVMAIWICVAVTLAVGGLVFVRRRRGHEIMQAHHAVAGPFLSIIATLYAVVLGFIVVDALNTYQKGRLTVEQEANCFHDMWHLAQGLSDPTRSDVRKLCLEYADTMVNFEWPEMEFGRTTGQGHQIYTRLWHDICHYQPKDGTEGTFLSSMLESLKTAGDARHTRLLAAQPVYDPSIWVVLGVGAVITIVFTYFFGIENLKVQALMTALVTVVVTLNLVVVALFSSPFSGDVKVPPRAFQADLDYFHQESRDH